MSETDSDSDRADSAAAWPSRADAEQAVAFLKVLDAPGWKPTLGHAQGGVPTALSSNRHTRSWQPRWTHSSRDLSARNGRTINTIQSLRARIFATPNLFHAPRAPRSER